MPTLVEILTAVTDFITPYLPFVAAGAILGSAAWLLKKVIKAGR